jgi:peptide/nickel transport system substrate-binding protein
MNNDVAPFNNVKVRQAVNHAVNRLQTLRVWGGPSQGATTDQIPPPDDAALA